MSDPSSLHIGLVCAIPGEIRALVSGPGWTAETHQVAGRQLRVHQGELRLPTGGTARVYACAGGIGAQPAAAAVGAICAAAGDTLGAWISLGWAGAITCGVKPAEVYVASEVVDAQTGERWATSTPRGAEPVLRTVTLNHVALAHEKRPLAERYQAVMVDMEGATVARLAHAQGLPFYCIKGISDGYTDVLPDFNRFITPQGTMRMLSLAAYALVRPQYWAPLVRMGSQSAAASRLLAQHLPACLERTGLVS